MVVKLRATIHEMMYMLNQDQVLLVHQERPEDGKTKPYALATI